MNVQKRRRWLMLLVYVATLGSGIFFGDIVVREYVLDYWTFLRPTSVSLRYDREGQIVRVVNWNRRDLQPLRRLPHLHYLDVAGLDLGNDQLRHLKDLDKLQFLRVGYNHLTDEAAPQLAQLKRLQLLSLDDNTSLTDAALPSFAELPALRQLDVRKTQVTAEGVQRLKQQRPKLRILYSVLESNGLARLNELGVDYERGPHYELTAIDLARLDAGDDEVALLAGIKSLKMLHLGGTHVTDSGLRHIAELFALEELFLSDTEIGDAGVAHLQNLDNLKALSLTRTAITNEALPYLQGLAKLEALHLGETQIDDNGLKTLASMTSLKKIWLDGVSVGNDEVEQLKVALPEAQISANPAPGNRGEDAELADEIERRAVTG